LHDLLTKSNATIGGSKSNAKKSGGKKIRMAMEERER
jgi:hypothetical protein